jgi:hypothetical protein
MMRKFPADILVFACRQIPRGWIKAETKKQIEIHPTHWREWTEGT